VLTGAGAARAWRVISVAAGQRHVRDGGRRAGPVGDLDRQSRIELNQTFVVSQHIGGFTGVLVLEPLERCGMQDTGVAAPWSAFLSGPYRDIS
jgi:hypothetical protein